MDQTTPVQSEAFAGETEDRSRQRKLVSIATIILALVNVIVGAIIDIRLEFFSTSFPSFWTQTLMTVFILTAAFTIRYRGAISLVLNTGIFVYFYINYISPYFFGR